MDDVKPVRPGWYNAFRPWTLHGAVVPVAIGGMAAYHDGSFCWWIFLMVLLCGCLLQSAANLLNTYGDFVKGTDTVENETRSPELVTGAIKPRSVFLAGMACLAVTALCGAVFVWYVGWGIILFGVAGIAGAGLYTVGVSYKYHGLGQIGVFALMGVLMPLGTYYVMTGGLSWEVFLISLPNAFLITAVLSGNETRDYHEDHKSGVRTLSSHFSYEGSMRVYLAQNVIAYPVLAVLLILGTVPWTASLALVALVDLRTVVRNSRLAPTNEGNSRLLVPLCFRHNWHFGVLLVAGCLIGYYAMAPAI
ncbi:MAG: 1,4-dihydroxy-2-naphthoate octaprenyltransferase [Candidatus Methanoplasma sp.]|jgi:1,4-dihydroxy-2-naphthoate octaprenyltransferase|nr:1,4-dihydroxy-2-naphthoate octaprenyltransferase [Candidatus Methanoplasma sp.]